MSHTNLVLGGNWEKGEWPEFVDVGHEGSSDGRRYLPQRTCQMEQSSGYFRTEVMTWFCSECGSPIYNDVEPSFCPYCGGDGG